MSPTIYPNLENCSLACHAFRLSKASLFFRCINHKFSNLKLSYGECWNTCLSSYRSHEKQKIDNSEINIHFRGIMYWGLKSGISKGTSIGIYRILFVLGSRKSNFPWQTQRKPFTSVSASADLHNNRAMYGRGVRIDDSHDSSDSKALVFFLSMILCESCIFPGRMYDRIFSNDWWYRQKKYFSFMSS